MSDDPNWFIGERSEALAYLLLTSRSDLAIESEKKHDAGVDFFVGLNEPGNVLKTKFFVIQVKGTLSSDQRVWTEDVRQLYKRDEPYYLPACVFVVNVRTNESAYAWVAEPDKANGSPRLKFFEHPEFHALDRSAVDQIVSQVRSWYDALPRPLVSTAS